MQRLIMFMTMGILAAALALGAPAGAFAQGPAGRAQWIRARLGGPEQSLVGTAAAQPGVSRVELLAQLRSAMTLAEALRAGGVDVASFADSFIASRAERLSAAVAAGALTRAEADARLDALRANVTARLERPVQRGWSRRSGRAHREGLRGRRRGRGLRQYARGRPSGPRGARRGPRR
ncbi:MAG: hypothetical protein RMK84_03735 [Oscillochloridaceae bacterium]|nr:hypothetical protein [Chloroflexaceae bacterium]MDW8389217.1 hypothetical protein [Oscillochloridaceae bacterium]